MFRLGFQAEKAASRQIVKRKHRRSIVACIVTTQQLFDMPTNGPRQRYTAGIQRYGLAYLKWKEMNVFTEQRCIFSLPLVSMSGHSFVLQMRFKMSSFMQ